MTEEKENSLPLSKKLIQFINVPRAVKTQMSFLVSEELTEKEKEDIVIICSFLIDEALQVE